MKAIPSRTKDAKTHWGKLQAAALLVLLLTACTQESQAEQITVTATPTIAPTPTTEPTLSAAEIREQRLNEIAAVVRANENTFTREEINTYLRKYGTGWEGGVETIIEPYVGAHTPFKYFFVENNKDDCGVYLSPVPYQHSSERTMSDKNNFATPDVVSEVVLGEITEAIYDDLWIRPEGNMGEFGEDWIDEPGAYTTVIYMQEGISEDGEVYDEMFPEIGGFFFIDSEGRLWKDTGSDVRFISLEDIANGDLSDEELRLFSDDVLKAIQEGWTMFVSDTETGEMKEARSNFKYFKARIKIAFLEQ